MYVQCFDQQSCSTLPPELRADQEGLDVPAERTCLGGRDAEHYHALELRPLCLCAWVRFLEEYQDDSRTSPDLGNLLFPIGQELVVVQWGQKIANSAIVRDTRALECGKVGDEV